MPVAKPSQTAAPGAVPPPDSLLAMRVSEVLKLHDGALDLLVAHGFTPLAQAHLRTLLAPTVTLAQAIRLKSLSAGAQERLMADLRTLLDARPVAVDESEPRDLGAACR